MPRNTKTYILNIALLISATALQAQSTFQRTYGGTDSDEGAFVLETTDGGFVIAGTTSSFASGGSSGIFLIRTDANGDTLSTRIICGNPPTVSLQACAIFQTRDKGFILSGIVNTGFPDANILLLKTDSNGYVQWEKGYGATSADAGLSVIQAYDGGYVIGGMTVSGSENACIIKTDSAGNTLWKKIYGGDQLEGCNAVCQTTDSGFILAGYTNTFGAGSKDAYLMKISSSGATLWSRTYGRANGSDVATDIRQTSDGDYIVVGYSAKTLLFNFDVYLLKLNTNGDTLWTRTYGGMSNDFGISVRQTTDSCFIIAGTTESFGAIYEETYLLKVDLTGTLLWSKTYTGTCHSILETSDGGFIAVGRAGEAGAGMGDVFVIKTDRDGDAGCSQGNPPTITDFPATIVTLPNTNIYTGLPEISFTPNVIQGNTFTAKVCEEYAVVMPNVFSPNGDGLNDYFNAMKINGIKRATLIIFDRWGIKLSEVTNISTGWDGKHNDQDCPDGTYYWILRYTTLQNSSKTLKGFLTLQR